LWVTGTVALWNRKTEEEAPWPGPAFAGYGSLVFAVIGVLLAGAFSAGWRPVRGVNVQRA
jgi:hypothetical protein